MFLAFMYVHIIDLSCQNDIKTDNNLSKIFISDMSKGNLLPLYSERRKK